MLRRAAGPATAGLAPGECGLISRGFAAADPGYLRFWDADTLGYRRDLGVWVDYGPMGTCGPDAFPVKCTWTRITYSTGRQELLGWLQELLDPAKQWSFRVTRSQGDNCSTPCWRLMQAGATPGLVPEKP